MTTDSLSSPANSHAKRPSLLVDGNAFLNNGQLGVQRYFRELLGRIAADFSVDLLLDGPPAVALPMNCNVVRRTEYFPTPWSNPSLKVWRRLRREVGRTRTQGHALFHSTFFTPSSEVGVPEVVTLHDMIPELHRQYFDDWADGNIEAKKQSFAAAQRIICISKATADDLARVYPQWAHKTCIVHSGADHLPARPVRNIAPPAAGTAKLLFVGDRGQYKNFGVVLAAMSEPSWPSDLQLVVVGLPWTAAEQTEIDKRGLARRIRFEGRVDDGRLAELYASATGFIFPSISEGFGLPALEAQSAGTPLLCSDIAVFHEVAADAAVYFDPANATALAAAAAVVLDPSHVNALRERGWENVKRFRWQRCAEETMAVYHEAIKKSSDDHDQK